MHSHVTRMKISIWADVTVISSSCDFALPFGPEPDGESGGWCRQTPACFFKKLKTLNLHFLINQQPRSCMSESVKPDNNTINIPFTGIFMVKNAINMQKCSQSDFQCQGVQFFFPLQLFSTNYHNKSLSAKAVLPREPPVGKTPYFPKGFVTDAAFVQIRKMIITDRKVKPPAAEKDTFRS